MGKIDYFASREQDRKEERELAKEYQRSGIDAAKALIEMKELLAKEQAARKRGDLISRIIAGLSVVVTLFTLFFG